MAATALAAVSMLHSRQAPANNHRRQTHRNPQNPFWPSTRSQPPSSLPWPPQTMETPKRLESIADDVRRFCKMGNLKEAISHLDDSISGLDHDTICSVMQLCADLGSSTDARKIHSSMLSSSSIEIDNVLGSKLVFMYVKCGDLREGRRVFDNMVSREHPFLWTLLMNEYAKAGHFRESISLFRRMRDLGVHPNSYTFSCILKCFASLDHVHGGEHVHASLLKLGFHSYNAVGNSLIAFYSKCNRLDSAIDLFDGMPDRDIISWNSIINGCVSNGLTRKAIQLFEEMWSSSGTCLDLATLVTVLPAFAELGVSFLSQGRALHGYSIKCALAKEITLGNSLLDMYSKCGDLGNAVRLFKEMGQRSIVSWTSMISGYAHNGRFEEAIALFGQMESEGMKPDLHCITTVLHVCASNGSLEEGKYVHDFIGRSEMQSNVFVANALMDMYAKCGCMEAARLVFDSTINKDLISWNTMIGGYSKNSLPNEALKLFKEMQFQMKPNSVTMACALPSCASISSLERGREIHGHTLRAGYASDNHVANALVDMYAKCGALPLARLLFDRIPTRDLISWTVMIAGYGMHGHGKDAISIFKEMRRKGVEPDEVSFIAVLYACSHSGLIHEGWMFFNFMRNDFKIEPKLEHYACMVDLLSRAGRLAKAYTFIESMPIEPDSTIWGALLCGCRIHRDVKLAEFAAERVFELEPENTGYYILLANIYSEAEKWEDVKKIRERIGGRRLRKNPGCSWIEIKRKLYVFVSGDKSHPQAKMIESFLEGVSRRMKDEGYIPKRRYALMNVDDRMKEEAICGHSEKLAIAFGILNSRDGKPIRVTKNLRVCGDCHEVAKFISRTVSREIILRDSNRFHHFEEGRCSCRGYW